MVEVSFFDRHKIVLLLEILSHNVERIEIDKDVLYPTNYLVNDN